MGNIPVMNKKIIFSGIITTALLLFLQSASYAGVYKWVDQDGQVHYGDKPADKADAKKVIIRDNETTKPRPVRKTKEGDDNTQQGSNSVENETGDKTARQPTKTDQPTISKREKKQLCNEAKSDIAAITSRGRMREKNANGEYSYLSEKQRQQRLAAAKKKQREFCR